MVSVNIVADGFVSSASTSYFTGLLLKKLNVSGLVDSGENYELLILAELNFRFIHIDFMMPSLFFF